MTDIPSSDSPMFGCLVDRRGECAEGAFWTTPGAGVADVVGESGMEEDLRGLGDADVFSLPRRDLAWASMTTEMSGLRERADGKARRKAEWGREGKT